MAFTLREYQQRSIDELFAWFEKGGQGNPLMVLPTAAGKSVILAAMIKHILAQWPATRIGMLTHVKELIQQNYEKLITLWPEAPAGIYSAGIGRKEVKAQILYAGIQSIANIADNAGHFDLLFVDEAHLIPKSGQGRYLKFIQVCRSFNPHLRVIGLTATPFRLDSGYLWDGKDAIFSAVATEVTIQELLKLGYLCPLSSKPTHVDIDMDGCKKRGGEFAAGDIERIFEDADHIAKALDNAMSRAADRHKWLVFTATVKHAQQATDYLRAHGISAEYVSGETAKDDRSKIIADFRAGNIKALCNCEVFTTGFDVPDVDCLVFLRPTESTGLYIQMMGRGMRIYEGKGNCLVLDYAGNIERHGCVDDPIVNVPKQQREPGEAPVKVCPNCDAFCHASATVCADCGHEFPPRQIAVERTHSTAAVLSDQIEPRIETIADIEANIYQKSEDKPATLQITYILDDWYNSEVKEWICFNHKGYAYKKAAQWWLSHGGEFMPPESVEEAIKRANEIRWPKRIEIIQDGKFERIGQRFFDEQAAA